MKHIVITPYHNEEEFIKKTLNSVVKQSSIPTLWILINDHSTDDSGSIVEEYSNQYDWIMNVNAKIKKEKRKEGAKIIRLVQEALDYVDLKDYDIFTKLDADITFDKNYFKEVIDHFKKNKDLGLCGGIILSMADGEYIDEKRASYHVRGANKSYRISSMLETNCFRPIMGWDGLDEMILMYHGYDVKLLDERAYQERMTRERVNELSFYFENGYAKYRLGHSFLLVLVRSFKRMFDKPYVACGVNYFLGHLWAMVNREELIIEKDIARFINRFHYRRIFKFRR